MTPFNPMRGEALAELGGRQVRLCVTLSALARMEAHFGVGGFDALSARLSDIGARDVMVILQAVAMEDIAGLDVTLREAVGAVVAVFEAAA